MHFQFLKSINWVLKLYDYFNTRASILIGQVANAHVTEVCLDKLPNAA